MRVIFTVKIFKLAMISAPDCTQHSEVVMIDIICRLLFRECDVTRVHIASPIHSTVAVPAHYASACLSSSSSIAIGRDVVLIALAHHAIHTMPWEL
jgi:hypothetical protein